jgi:hypothetical protein
MPQPAGTRGKGRRLRDSRARSRCRSQRHRSYAGLGGRPSQPALARERADRHSSFRRTGPAPRRGGATPGRSCRSAWAHGPRDSRSRFRCIGPVARRGWSIPRRSSQAAPARLAGSPSICHRRSLPGHRLRPKACKRCPSGPENLSDNRAFHRCSSPPRRKPRTQAGRPCPPAWAPRSPPDRRSTFRRNGLALRRGSAIPGRPRPRCPLCTCTLPPRHIHPRCRDSRRRS